MNPDIDFEKEGKTPKYLGENILRAWKVEAHKFIVLELSGREFVALVKNTDVEKPDYSWSREMNGHIFRDRDMWVIGQHRSDWAKAWAKISGGSVPDAPPYWYIKKEVLAGRLAFRNSMDVETWLGGNGWKKDSKTGDDFWLKKVGRGIVRLHGVSLWSDEIKLYAYPSAATRKGWGEYGSPELAAKGEEFNEQTSRWLKIKGSYGKYLEDKAVEVSQAVNSYRPAPVRRVRTEDDKVALEAFLLEARREILKYLKTDGQNEYTGKWNEGRTTRWLSSLLLWDSGGLALYDRHFGGWDANTTYTKKDVGKLFSKLLKQMETEGLVKLYRDGSPPEWFKLASVPDIGAAVRPLTDCWSITGLHMKTEETKMSSHPLWLKDRKASYKQYDPNFRAYRGVQYRVCPFCGSPNIRRGDGGFGLLPDSGAGEWKSCENCESAWEDERAQITGVKVLQQPQKAPGFLREPPTSGSPMSKRASLAAKLQADWFSKTAASYFDMFFKEKRIPSEVFEVTDSQGVAQVGPLENVLSPGKPSEHPEVLSFLNDMERAFKQHFPKGHYTARAEKKFGGYGIYITTHTLPEGQQSNGILQNDPSRNTFWMHGSYDESGMKDRIRIEISEGGSLAVAPAPDSYMAFDMIKVGWRNGTGKPAAIVRKFDQYFAKLARAVKENAHRLKAGSKTASNNLLWSIVDERAYPHAMFASDGGELSKRWFKTAEAPIHWKGRHIIIDSARMMSFKEIPKDEHGQVYDAALLTRGNGVRMKKLVDQIVRGNKEALLRLKTPYEATRFVDQKVVKTTGKSKTPDWHTYSMPN